MDASTNFRSESFYNNVIYSLAGHVIERLGGGRSWESLLRELVLDPLNMTQTWFYDAPDNPDRLAQAYLHPGGVTSAWTPPASLPSVKHLFTRTAYSLYRGTCSRRTVDNPTGAASGVDIQGAWGPCVRTPCQENA